MYQELCSLREQNQQLQYQSSNATAAAQEAKVRADSLAADNQTLQDELAKARSTVSQNARQVADLMAEVATLRSEKMALETAKHAAEGNAATWEQKYKTQETVSRPLQLLGLLNTMQCMMFQRAHAWQLLWANVSSAAACASILQHPASNFFHIA